MTCYVVEAVEELSETPLTSWYKQSNENFWPEQVILHWSQLSNLCSIEVHLAGIVDLTDSFHSKEELGSESLKFENI